LIIETKHEGPKLSAYTREVSIIASIKPTRAHMNDHANTLGQILLSEPTNHKPGLRLAILILPKHNTQRETEVGQ
jgi:hypothetical protein